MAQLVSSTNGKDKPVLAVDVDEVLAYFIPSLAVFHNETYRTSNAEGGHAEILTSDSFHSYEFCNVWGGTMEESYIKMEAFFESVHFKERIEPIPYALEVLLELKEVYDLHVVTSRQHKIEALTLQWIDRHFPGVFTSIHFGNHYSREGKSRSKPDMCREIGAVLLIDDSLVYATQCHRVGIPVVLFGQYAWNQLAAIPASEQEGVCLKDFDTTSAAGESASTSTGTSTGPSSSSGCIYRVTDWRDMPAAIKHVLQV
eukprot:CAMPEP_0174974902 /NCGR_PEP_ID=MMETSP0004_2-20121128/12127_1 /TAXON_ID=420556 /ORGANISM="Ochromonas sp., Strain CCMP1393" /LENGTH=256 /DNA_ID=CAMNT_0016225657 /DNA_START=3 /DNA_END=773 /DNA_ORIENTATION=-